MFPFLVFMVPVLLLSAVVMSLVYLSPLDPFGRGAHEHWYALVAISVILLGALFSWGRSRSLDSPSSERVAISEKLFLRSVALWFVIGSFLVFRLGWNKFLANEWWRALAIAVLQAVAWMGFESFTGPVNPSAPLTLEKQRKHVATR